MTPATIKLFESLLLQQNQCVALLHKILVEENNALVDRDFDAIQKASRDKSEQTLLLDNLSQQQRQLFQESGFGYSPEGIKSFINSMPRNIADTLQTKQTALENELEACQKQNLINGNIIAANKYSAETALSILRGQHTPNNLVYGAAGQTVTAAPPRPSIKA